MNAHLLDELGWEQFEALCQAVLKAKLGLDVEAWGGHSDLGRDAYWAFTGTHPLLQGGVGPFLFQAKFVQNANSAGAKPGRALEQAVSAECKAINARSNHGTLGKFQTYVLLTNAPLSSQLRMRVTGKLQTALPGITVRAWGSEDLCRLLTDVPHVRAAFPQLLGLSDLETILANVVDKSLVHRSRACLESALELEQTFVPTATFLEALELLTQHHFVVLRGPPEVGKTTIARIIGLRKFQEGWQCHECQSPKDFFQLRAHGQRQVFIVDDAFGSTEYRPECARAWSDNLDAVLRSLGPDCWIVWTSRSAPLEQALNRMNLQGKAENFPAASNLLVDASSLSPEERAQILYRHVECASLPERLKKSFHSRVLEAAAHQHFTPFRARRWIERLRKYTWTEEVSATDELLGKTFLEEFLAPSEMMRKSLQQLPDEHRAMLISLLDIHESPMEQANIADAFHRLFPEMEADVRQHLDELEGHCLRGYDGHGMLIDGGCVPLRGYRWTHPNWRDLLIEQLRVNRTMRRQFLSRCSVFGAELALSGAGGVAGEREYPLLQEPSDWRALTEGCSRFIGQESYPTQHFLGAILDALLRERPQSKQGQKKQELLELARSVLTSCRAAWNAEPEWLTFALLDRYYRISEFLDPLPESPSLHAYWTRVTHALAHALDAADFLSVRHALEEWALLVELLVDNEPRFLRQVELPDSCEELLDNLNSCLEVRSRSWTGLEEASALLKLIHKLMKDPNLSPEIEPVEDMLNERVHRLQRKQKTAP